MLSAHLFGATALIDRWLLFVFYACLAVPMQAGPARQRNPMTSVIFNTRQKALEERALSPSAGVESSETSS